MSKKKKTAIFAIIALILIAAAICLAVFGGGHKLAKDRDIFAECALVAQSQMNYHYPDKHIRDYAFVQDLKGEYIGCCFNFDGGGYVIVTSYDYIPQIVEPDTETPFAADPDMSFEKICIFSTQPVAVKLYDSNGGDAVYRIFDGGNRCFLMDSSTERVISSLSGEKFYLGDIIQPQLFSDPVVSVGRLSLNDYQLESVPDEKSRSNMTAICKKQMLECGYDLDAYAKEVNLLRRLYEYHLTVPLSEDGVYDREEYLDKMSNTKLFNLINKLESKLGSKSRKGAVRVYDTDAYLQDDSFDLR